MMQAWERPPILLYETTARAMPGPTFFSILSFAQKILSAQKVVSLHKKTRMAGINRKGALFESA
jgi:hypothetical protein